MYGLLSFGRHIHQRNYFHQNIERFYLPRKFSWASCQWTGPPQVIIDRISIWIRFACSRISRESNHTVLLTQVWTLWLNIRLRGVLVFFSNSFVFIAEHCCMVWRTSFCSCAAPLTDTYVFISPKSVCRSGSGSRCVSNDGFMGWVPHSQLPSRLQGLRQFRALQQSTPSIFLGCSESSDCCEWLCIHLTIHNPAHLSWT